MTDYNDVLDKMISQMRREIAFRAKLIKGFDDSGAFSHLAKTIKNAVHMHQTRQKRELAAIIRLRRHNRTLEREFKQYYSTGFGGKMAKWTVDEVVNAEARKAIE